MQKDVIYIDVDDDITAIIGKIKASSEKIIALVPPKRVGVLQSAVNLRLLDRMAKSGKKQLVIITGNQALIGLTASAHIPVAKNLQSKPEIAEIPALKVDDEDDIIDGADLPIGEHAGSAAAASEAEDEPIPHKAASTTPLIHKPTRDEVVDDLEIDGVVAGAAAESSTKAAKAAKSSKPKVKIPNFDSFRKRLFLIVLVAVLLVAGLIWAFAIAPAATITITAATSPAPISGTVKLGGSAATNVQSGTISSEEQTLKKNATVQFTATGTADDGTKATGTVVFKNCETSDPETIPAGTTITTDGMNYTTQADASVSGASGFASCSHAGTSSSVPVTASAPGDSYNVDSGTTFSVSGHNSPSQSFYFKATADSDFTGGESKTVTVVSSDDIQRALGEITGQSTDAAKKQLESQFTNGELVIDSSFNASQGTPTSSPAQGQQVPDGSQATLTVPMTYTMYAFPKAGVETYLNSVMGSQITSQSNQKVYDNGLGNVAFGNFQTAGDGSMTVTLTATGQIGPNIDVDTVKKESEGKITGDIQSQLDSIQGVQDVQVSYSYFWVHKVPSDPNKIDVEFKLSSSSS